jgi:hypothetical protein
MRNGMASRIRTAVVGSYPVLPWMAGHSSRLVLRDAIDHVVARMDGIRHNFTRAEVDRHRADRAHGYRLSTRRRHRPHWRRDAALPGNSESAHTVTRGAVKFTCSGRNSS